MTIIGKRNTLTALRISTPGLYLDGGETGEILLPNRYIPRGVAMGDLLDVFVYLDSEDRLVATTDAPLATVGEFASLKVVSVNTAVGAFLDWGLPKDLLLPFREQNRTLYPGDFVVVYILLDQKTNRVVATTRLNRHLSHQPPPYKVGQPVKLLIASKTPSGYNAIIENAHRGLLYGNNLSAPLEIGQRLEGFIRTLRPDGKIDLSLDASGYKRVAPLTEQIIEALHRNAGHLDFDDDSAPEAIRQVFSVSKKAFKQALGSLYKARRITFQNYGIDLVKKK